MEKFRIPNPKFPEEVTFQAWCRAANTREFLRFAQYARESYPKKITIAIDRKPSIQMLLEANDDCDAYEVIRNYYSQFNKDLEDKRFSNLSKDFFRCLKKIYKYDHFDKRDGSVISSIKTINKDNEELITNHKEVNKQLILTIKELQFDASKPLPKNLDFPEMKSRDIDEMKDILKRLSSGKAIAWDALTDSIFSKTWREKSALLFADLWQNLKLIKNQHFESRLIPLNKLHPNIPTRRDMRPIIVTSPLVKLIEAGIMPDLTKYLVQKLHYGQ